MNLERTDKTLTSKSVPPWYVLVSSPKNLTAASFKRGSSALTRRQASTRNKRSRVYADSKDLWTTDVDPVDENSSL